MTNYKKVSAKNTPRVELHEKLNLTGARNLNTFEKINLSKPLKNGYFFVKF